MFQKILLTCCIVLLPLLTTYAQNMTWEEKLSDKYKLDVPRTDGKPTITAAAPIAAAPLAPEARLAYLAEQSRRVEQAMATLDATKPDDARQLEKYRKTLATFEAEKLEINKKQKPTKNK
jgi:hypothetical protein